MVAAPHYMLNTDPPQNGNIGEASIATLKGGRRFKRRGAEASYTR